MVLENELDLNLFYLEQLLFSLDSYKFDRDILSKIMELQDLVCKKINSSLPTGDYDILDIKVKQIFYLKKY